MKPKKDIVKITIVLEKITRILENLSYRVIELEKKINPKKQIDSDEFDFGYKDPMKKRGKND